MYSTFHYIWEYTLPNNVLTMVTNVFYTSPLLIQHTRCIAELKADKWLDWWWWTMERLLWRSSWKARKLTPSFSCNAAYSNALHGIFCTAPSLTPVHTVSLFGKTAVCAKKTFKCRLFIEVLPMTILIFAIQWNVPHFYWIQGKSGRLRWINICGWPSAKNWNEIFLGLYQCVYEKYLKTWRLG